MLEPGIIPSQEPDIRVGIILPEDAYTSIAIEIPGSAAYQLEFSGRTFSFTDATKLFLKNKANGIHFEIDGKGLLAGNEITIFPVEESDELLPQQGLKVKNVISGRDFHWKKYIDVNFAGKLIIRKLEDRIIVINELPIEQYLMCVATSEMGATCPIALIEAQTIAARSWMLANVEQKHVALGMDVCNDDCCQRYQGTTYLTPQSVKGALNTYGKVLISDDKICDARYSKSCGGMMEAFENIWPGNPLPYLQIKEDAATKTEFVKGPLSEENNFKEWVKEEPDTFCSPHTIPEDQLQQYLGSVDEGGKYFRWQVRLTEDELIQNIKKHHNIPLTAVENISVLERGGSGRAKQVAIDYLDKLENKKRFIIDNEFSIRQTMHRNFLYSSAFVIQKEDDKTFLLHGAGWGHGVGLCQIGALGMSLKKHTSPEIVSHYFPGSELTKIY